MNCSARSSFAESHLSRGEILNKQTGTNLHGFLTQRIIRVLYLMIRHPKTVNTFAISIFVKTRIQSFCFYTYYDFNNDLGQNKTIEADDSH